ncbi:hypothetical protein [Streptomyces sp. SYP-A7185]|uniref:hypothetical protein n=1 Tax=Streptomyces sp. SYP-A7185 TaxID=3040076 RepID=UPI0038F6F762
MAQENAACPVATVIRWARGAGGLLGEATGLLLRPLVMTVLDRIDLDAVIARVDVNRVADRVDVERVAVRVDVDRVADRVDVDRVADRVDVGRVADRVDVDRVADRVDVDRVADRVDVDAVLDRIDLVGLTRDVLREIDLGRIVRDTGGGMTVETVEAVRVLGRRGDRNVNRLADRLLRRTGRSDGDGGPPQGDARFELPRGDGPDPARRHAPGRPQPDGSAPAPP